MNPVDGLRNDYLEYLRDCGADVPTDKPAPAALASALEEIARSHPDEILRRSVMEHLEAAATVQKLSGRPVDDTPARLAVGIGSSDLARYVDAVLAGLTEDDKTFHNVPLLMMFGNFLGSGLWAAKGLHWLWTTTNYCDHVVFDRCKCHCAFAKLASLPVVSGRIIDRKASNCKKIMVYGGESRTTFELLHFLTRA